MKSVWNSNVLYVKFHNHLRKVSDFPKIKLRKSLEFQEHLPKKYGIPLKIFGKKVWNSDVLYRGWFIIIWNSPLPMNRCKEFECPP